MIGPELACLALTVYFEARGEPPVAQLEVAHVVLERVRQDRWPDTICEVVWDDRQFSWTHDGKSDKPHNAKAWETAQWIAELALAGCGPRYRGATHYHATYVDPYWAHHMDRLGQEGLHVFYQ